ncbi:MAG TPA: cytochrome c oxidase subunit 3 [Tepidisphaeraceae bacterium]|jgi:cytochrome c oxidase subunit 3|nr:cytochrome c oxidase subunit 3 [Tepidisphaeraceae bacterium]
MSHAATNPTVVAAHNGHHHDPHLAHHFETPEQQYQSGKLGMWVFLATEILMFGGLFCAYSVYRHNHPEVFEFAHKALDPVLGGINTVVLITSSLTMAWGVRAAQLGQKRLLIWCLALTIIGGAGFMAIKSIEYNTKWKHNLFPGSYNVYSKTFTGEETPPLDLAALNSEGHHAPAHEAGEAAPHPVKTIYDTRLVPHDPNAGTPDEAKIKPSFATSTGMVTQAPPAAEEHLIYTDLGRDRHHVTVFFSIYFLMTGLHGIHVLVGMSLIYWLLRRAIASQARFFADGLAVTGTGLFFVYLGWLIPLTFLLIGGAIVAAIGIVIALMFAGRALRATGEGEFDPTYFTPVDLVGLYWHLVDLIWIFLFPLLYLIR